jgi:hypothetical protein
MAGERAPGRLRRIARDRRCRARSEVCALGGIRTPSLQIRRHGHIVQDHPSRSVCWAGVPQFSISGRLVRRHGSSIGSSHGERGLILDRLPSGLAAAWRFSRESVTRCPATLLPASLAHADDRTIKIIPCISREELRITSVSPGLRVQSSGTDFCAAHTCALGDELPDGLDAAGRDVIAGYRADHEMGVAGYLRRTDRPRPVQRRVRTAPISAQQEY